VRKDVMMNEQKNPHIEQFCRALVAKKGEKLEEDALEKLVESLYRLFENMLGRNMVAALPVEMRTQYVAKYDKGGRDVDLEEVGKVFQEHVTDPAEIMKRTAREFAALYFKNRPGDMPAPWDAEGLGETGV
jgi:hypothetical protein